MTQVPDILQLKTYLTTALRPMFSARLEVVGYKLRGEIFGAGLGRY